MHATLSQEGVDNDDGSAYYKTHDNFLVYGAQGIKNDFGGHDNHHFDNIYAYVGRGLGVCSQLKGHEDYFYSNKVVLTGTDVGQFRCTSDDEHGFGKTIVHDNSYYTATGNVTECGTTLDKWQAMGADHDSGSVVAPYPKDDVVIGWARAKLGF